MARILIRNLGKSFEVTDLSRTLLDHIQQNRIDWMHSCGAKGKCTTCAAVMIEGSVELSHLTSAEIQYRESGQLSSQERLACQVKVHGDIVIDVPEENKLPHLEYDS
jgi:2Fe-2S ferredoxin